MNLDSVDFCFLGLPNKVADDGVGSAVGESEWREVANLPPLMLSYIGDAVFTLFIRGELIKSGEVKSGEVTKACAKLVSAVSQSAAIEALLPLLTDEERELTKRCRNAHSNSRAKNAALSDYKRATALEGLLGFLYLTRSLDRLNHILKLCLSFLLTPKKNQNKNGENL